MSTKYLQPAAAIREGFLTAAEVKQLTEIANRYKTTFYVVGSRARGNGRNISRSHLPVGKGAGTRSDIDIRIDGQKDIFSGGRLSHEIANVGGGAGKSMVLIGTEPTPPAILFEPS